MEPITHMLTGAAIGRTGLNRKTAYATVVAAIAAEAADIDILWSLSGPVSELKNHRGLTHTFLLAPLVAGATVGLAWIYHQWKQRRAQHRLSVAAPLQNNPAYAPRNHQNKIAPHWGWLYLTALIASLSHLLLDWTNNYGVRPFFPFNPRWYAGSIVFIAEPLLWLALGLAFILPWLFGLVDREIGARREKHHGQGWAVVALVAMVLMWGWRTAEADDAHSLLEHQPISQEQVLRTAMEPYPVNPYRWHALIETPAAWQTAEINTLTGEVEPNADRIEKPKSTPALTAAKATPLGLAYMDWGSWAVVRDLGQVPVADIEVPKLGPNRTWTTVEFTDLRFKYSFMGTASEPARAPLTAWVLIVDGHDEAGQALGHRVEK